MQKFLLFFLLLSPVLSTAKRNDVPAEYQAAVSFAQKATEQLKTGNIKEADSLIKLSIKTCPVMDVLQYAYALVGRSDDRV